MAAVASSDESSIRGEQRGDQIFRLVLRICSLIGFALIAGLVLVLVLNSLETIGRFGAAFLTGQEWNPVAGEEQFGALPFIFGTVVTSLIALILATPLAIGSALFVSEYAPRWLGVPVAFLVELLVAIPSVAYGIWTVFVLAPFMRDQVDPFLHKTLGRIPGIGALFPSGPGVQVTGFGLLTAGVILPIMILPTILSISLPILAHVPRPQTERMLALGATKLEVLSKTILPFP